MNSNGMLEFKSFYQNTIPLSNITELYLHQNKMAFTNRNFAGFTNLRTLGLISSRLTTFELMSSDTPNLQILNGEVIPSE